VFLVKAGSIQTDVHPAEMKGWSR